MRKLIWIVLSFVSLAGNVRANGVQGKSRIEQGRWLVRIAGCNDCHTPNYSQLEGNVPEKDWLVGSEVGFKGPWGTSYATNLRLTVEQYTEAAFVSYLRQKRYLPPMPGFIFKHLTNEEIASVHAYIKQLGVAGKRTPRNLPPSQKPKGPYIYFVPQVDSK